jgi:hypothetical protein
VKASKKEIYGSHGVAASGGSGDKLSESFRSVFELALESQGTERTAQLLERLAHELRSAPRPSGGQNTPYLNTIPHQEHHALERDGDGGEGEFHDECRRPHRIVRVIGDTLRGGAKSFLSRRHG